MQPFEESRKPRILLVDDDPEIHALVSEILAARGIQTISEYGCAQAITVALKELPDVILLDYSLPGTDGLQLLGRLRAAGIPESVPVIFITGNESLDILTRCFKEGAADYIRKPFCIPELVARVRSVLDRLEIMRQLEQQAMFDPLTRLGNRSSIKSKIQLAINLGDQRNSALLFLDFDRFKMINDSLGHDAGDELLKQFANRLTNSLRHTDVLGMLSNKSSTARLGGDEFVVLLENLADPDDSLVVAERLLKTLESPYYLSGHRVTCSASIGVVKDIKAYQTAEEVLRDADTAMYEAKASGRGRFVQFDAAMHAQVSERLQTESDLSQAIARDELDLFYQPIVCMETGRVQAFEALIRWNHPTRGLLTPIAFIGTAEDSDLIIPIGTWVLDRACRDFAIWQKLPWPIAPMSIHVNVSRKQLTFNLVNIVMETLKRHGVPPESLHLEVTENEMMLNPEVACHVLRDLRNLGVKIDLDDFGTGHSSLACLHDLPIDQLKIDRSFVANMQRNRTFAALVHAVVTLGQNTGLTVVSEGIETAEQLAMLQSMDCEFGQGYLFSKPMPACDVQSYLNNANSVRNHDSTLSNQSSLEATLFELQLD